MVNDNENLPILNESSISLEQRIDMETSLNFTKEFFLKNYEYSPKQIKLQDAHNQVIYAPDIHTYSISLDSGIRELQKDANGKKSVMILGDTNDRREHLGELYQTLGIPTVDTLKANYIAQKMSIEDAQSYSFVSQIKSSYGDISGYIEMSKNMGHSVDEGLENEYAKALVHYDNNNLEEKVKTLFNQQEYKQAETQIKIMGQVVDFANTQILAKQKAKKLYDANLDAINSGLGETIIIEENGNHGSLYDTHLFRQEYNDLIKGSNLSKAEDIIYNSMEVHGAIELGSGDDKFSFQIANNCPDNFPGLVGTIFDQYQIQTLFPACFDNTYMPGYSPEMYSQIDENEVFSMSQDAIRMSGLGLNPQSQPEKVDMVFLHDERGDPVGYEDKVNKNKKSTNVGLEVYLNHFAKKDSDGHFRIASGHWHKSTNGIVVDNTWKQKKSRSFMAKFGKNSFEELDVKPQSEEFNIQGFIDLANSKMEYAINLYQNINQKVIEAANDDNFNLLEDNSDDENKAA